MSHNSRSSVLAALLSVLLLSSSVAGLAVAGSPSAVDAQHSASVDGEAVVEQFIDRIETLETVEFTRSSETVVDNRTLTSTEQVAANLETDQKRVEIVDTSVGANATTVWDGNNVTTYNSDENTVTEYEFSSVSLLPRLQSIANDSRLDYEYLGTETVNGQETHAIALTNEELPASMNETQASATVYVDTETYFPVQYVTEFQSDDYSYSATVTYENVSINEDIPESTFELDIPDDAERPSSTPDVETETYDSHDELSDVSLSLPDADLPEGFSFDRATTFSYDDITSAVLSYTDGEESISVYTRTDSGVDVDYDESDGWERVDLNETTGYVYTNGEYLSLRFDDGQPYTVSGEISNSTAISIAESILED
jgi:outer membrane lipoprotein-sorting protein